MSVGKMGGTVITRWKEKKRKRNMGENERL
jgi:hypothetical protein